MKTSIWVRRWNKKIHIYLGLYMLLFLWLFSLSGLILNHENWFQSISERSIRQPAGDDDMAKAGDIQQQLKLKGKLLPNLRARGSRLNFRVEQPHDLAVVSADLEELKATIRYQPRNERVETKHSINPPKGKDDLARAMDVRSQLGLSGEILMGRNAPPPGHLVFSLLGGKDLTGINVDLKQGVATVTEREGTSLVRGILRTMQNLHTMTGVRRVWGEPGGSVRDWWVTKLWSFSMDAVAVGLIVLIVTSIYMWYQRRKTWLLGSVILLLGVVSCGFFLWGLVWLT